MENVYNLFNRLKIGNSFILKGAELSGRPIVYVYGKLKYF